MAWPPSISPVTCWYTPAITLSVTTQGLGEKNCWLHLFTISISLRRFCPVSFRVNAAPNSNQPYPSCTAGNLHIQRKLPPLGRSCTAQSWSDPAGMGGCMSVCLQREMHRTMTWLVETRTSHGREVDHFRGRYQSVCPWDRKASIHQCISPHTWGCPAYPDRVVEFHLHGAHREQCCRVGSLANTPSV